MAYEEGTYTALSTSIEGDAEVNLSDVFNRALARESAVWSAFDYNGPFASDHEDNRITLFGLYANVYLHGHNYLSEISAEDLQRLVDVYDNNIAKISNEEAQLVLEVATRRYENTLKDMLHENWKDTQQAKINAKNDDYDAEFDKYGIGHGVTYDSFRKSMINDYEALVTKRDDLLLAQQKAEHRITELETLIEIEDVNQQLVEVDITREELKAARADLDLINAQVRGLDIQLQITNAALDSTNTDLQITEAGNELEETNLRKTEVELQESNVDLDITRSGINLTKAQVEGERIQSNTQKVAVDVAETNLQIEETEAKEAQYQADIARIESNEAQLDLVDSELTLAYADKTIENAELDHISKEINLIDAKQSAVISETGFVETQQTNQEFLDQKQLDHDQSEHDFKKEVYDKTDEYEEDMTQKIEDLYDTPGGPKAEIITKNLDREEKVAQNDADFLVDTKAAAAEAYKDAAIEAAEMLAEANLITELTHTLGEGSELPGTNVTWNTKRSI